MFFKTMRKLGFNALTAVGALMTLIDFTLSNGEPLWHKG